MTKCLKCGVETPDGHTFCDHCVAVMDQYPIAPGTPVMILKRPEKPQRPVKKKRNTQAETIRRLYKQLRGVTFLCILFGALVVTLSVLLFLSLY